MRYGQYNKYNRGNLAEKHVSQPEIKMPHKSVIKEQRKKSNSLLRKRLILLGVTIILFAFTMVMRSNTLLVTGNDLVKLRQQEAEFIKQNDLLKLEVSKLNSPERINTLAKGALGMTIAKQNIYIDKNAYKQN